MIRSRVIPRVSRIGLAIGLGVLLAAAEVQSARATILLFDQQRDASTGTIVGPTTSGGMLPADYGDNVTGATMAVPGGFFTYGDGGEGFTPDVSLSIFANPDESDPRVHLWQNGYGDLVNVIFGEGPGTGGWPSLSVRLTAAPGYSVDLYGFDLAGYGNTDYTIAEVQVLAGAVTLFSEANVLVEGDSAGPGHTAFDFGMPLSAPELLLVVDLSNIASSIQDNIGLDSLRFGQTPPGVIPEPGTVLMLAGWLALWAAHRRGEVRARRRERSRSATS